MDDALLLTQTCNLRNLALQIIARIDNNPLSLARAFYAFSCIYNATNTSNVV